MRVELYRVNGGDLGGITVQRSPSFQHKRPLMKSEELIVFLQLIRSCLFQ